MDRPFPTPPRSPTKGKSVYSFRRGVTASFGVTWRAARRGMESGVAKGAGMG